MFFVYVLYRQKIGHFYTGQTANLSERLKQHNLGMSKSTIHGVPWRLVHSERFATRAEAMQRERFLKTGHGRDGLRQFLHDAATAAGRDEYHLQADRPPRV
jgi:putative endonuclease